MTNDTVKSCAKRMFEEHHKLTPMYAKAVADEDLQDLILIRSQFAATIMEADRIIADCIVQNIRRRYSRAQRKAQRSRT